MQRRRLEISGTVQGVGFRPHLHRLARRLSLTGGAGNHGDGVWCEIQGHGTDLDGFELLVRAEAPPLAVIESLRSVEVAPVEGERGFTIAASAAVPGATTRTVPGDVAPCGHCLDEIADPGERRYRYAFTCCTDCGPRYTVVRGLPYDRERTSMAAFELCDACEAEYRDPHDRRHHAQALSCPACGPQLSLQALAEDPPAGNGFVDGTAITDPADAVARAAALLRAGEIVAVKGVGGYQLVCRADDGPAVARLRRRKHREEKPFALLVASISEARTLVHLDDLAERALSGPEAPIVLAPRRESAPVAAAVAPDTRLLGVMLPATPLHTLLAGETGPALVCTSGNRSDEPIVTDDARVRDDLGGIADAVLSHNRVIERRADDSVGHVVAGGFQLLRRARGYAPRTVRLGVDGPPVLAVGAELKSTVCLALGRNAHVSVHLGDLEHPGALAAFEAAVSDLLGLISVPPSLVVHDLHPEYLSTKFAASAGVAPCLGVQHHHAHLASCLVDAGHRGPAIGVMFDGMGWGADATLWGGEILLGDTGGYERFAHLRPVPLVGGAAAIRRPWRMALAHIHAAFGAEAPAIPAFQSRAEEMAQVLEQCRAGQWIPTTSAGRLFDAVAALCGIAQAVTYEGQAAIRLEHVAGPDVRRYGVEFSQGTPEPGKDTPELGNGSPEHSQGTPKPGKGSPIVIECASVIEAVTADLLGGLPPPVVAAAFHRWVTDAVVAVARQAREASGLRAVALSGGVFQNRRLVELIVPELDQAGFKVLSHRQVPPNDGGISLGQAAVGRAMLSA